jgi:hypothetical protein
MADVSSVEPAAWVVEVLGDGTGARHRRYLVGAADRGTAMALALRKLGSGIMITSTSKVSAESFGVSNVSLGEVRPL